MASPTIAGASGPAHLFVLIHGLWGNPAHLKFLASSLRERFAQDNLHVLVPKRNSGNATYDGIEVGAERVTKEIEDEFERLQASGVKIEQLSIVGYSLGGIVGRFAAGLLYHRGWFQKIEPMNFTTFATPHLGVRSPVRGPHNLLWNILGARTLSTTGQQLFLIDGFRDTGRPLLSVMADPKSIFARALSAFKERTLYSNIINDRSAVYYTTYIAATDPFTDMSKVHVNYLPGYSPIIVDAADPVRAREPEPKPAAPLAAAAWPLLGSLLARARVALLLSVFLPIGGAVFLLNAAVQSVRSGRRIRMHAAGKAGVVPDQYRLPLMMVERARRTAEELFERVNASQAEEFLPDDGGRRASVGSGGDDGEAEPLLGDPAKIEGAGGEDGKAVPGPALALSQAQFDMVRNLDALGWNKFPVHIKEVMHTHAAIIVRMEREAFREGKVVVGHWLDNLKI